MAHVQANRFDHVTLIPEGTMPGFFLRTLAATFGIFMFLLFKPWKARNPRSRCYMGVGAFNLIRRPIGPWAVINRWPCGRMTISNSQSW